VRWFIFFHLRPSGRAATEGFRPLDWTRVMQTSARRVVRRTSVSPKWPRCMNQSHFSCVLHCVALCCSVLQCVAVCSVVHESQSFSVVDS